VCAGLCDIDLQMTNHCQTNKQIHRGNKITSLTEAKKYVQYMDEQFFECRTTHDSWMCFEGRRPKIQFARFSIIIPTHRQMIGWLGVNLAT